MGSADAPDDLSGPALTIWTVRLGTREQMTLPASCLYTFAETLPGLPDSCRFALIADEAYAPLRWLQSLDEWEICLPVLGLDVVDVEGYAAQVAEATGLSDPAEVRQRILLVAHFDAAAGAVAVNLLAPILLDHRRATGRQLVLDGQPRPLRQHVAWHPATRTFSPPC